MYLLVFSQVGLISKEPVMLRLVYLPVLVCQDIQSASCGLRSRL